jgi:hypothetical protein
MKINPLQQGGPEDRRQLAVYCLKVRYYNWRGKMQRICTDRLSCRTPTFRCCFSSARSSGALMSLSTPRARVRYICIGLSGCS